MLWYWSICWRTKCLVWYECHDLGMHDCAPCLNGNYTRSLVISDISLALVTGQDANFSHQACLFWARKNLFVLLFWPYYFFKRPYLYVTGQLMGTSITPCSSSVVGLSRIGQFPELHPTVREAWPKYTWECLILFSCPLASFTVISHMTPKLLMTTKTINAT